MRTKYKIYRKLKTKNSQIICMETKLGNFRGEPNKTYKK
jgi:hypothetical protein